MSVLIKDMEKPKSCYAVIDGEAEFCPFVNTGDDCVLLLKKGICEETWEMQYSKCPLVEVPELCEDALKKIKNASFVGSDGLDYVETLQALDALKDVIGVTLHVTKISKHCSDFSDLDEVIECEDAVSRKAAIDAVKAMEDKSGKGEIAGFYNLILERVVDKLNDLLPAQPETDCVLKEFGNCSYSETGCSDCKVKAKIRNALSAQPEPCEDAVSRKTAIEAVMDLCKHYTPTKSVNHPHVDFVIEALQDLPSVTPKRKTGKWILLEECANAGYYCSECRKRVVREGWSGTVRKIKFCPNCGADTRSEAEQEVK